MWDFFTSHWLAIQIDTLRLRWQRNRRDFFTSRWLTIQIDN